MAGSAVQAVLDRSLVAPQKQEDCLQARFAQLVTMSFSQSRKCQQAVLMAACPLLQVLTDRGYPGCTHLVGERLAAGHACPR